MPGGGVCISQLQLVMEVMAVYGLTTVFFGLLPTGDGVVRLRVGKRIGQLFRGIVHDCFTRSKRQVFFEERTGLDDGRFIAWVADGDISGNTHVFLENDISFDRQGFAMQQ